MPKGTGPNASADKRADSMEAAAPPLRREPSGDGAARSSSETEIPLKRALIMMLLALAACARGPSGHETRTTDVSGTPAPGVVDGTTAAALAARGARVVDVRTPQEFAAGHVPGAVNIPFDEIARRAGEFGDPDSPVVLYCRSGRRSAIAADALRSLGFVKVYDAQRYDRWPLAGGGGR